MTQTEWRDILTTVLICASAVPFLLTMLVAACYAKDKRDSQAAAAIFGAAITAAMWVTVICLVLYVPAS